MSEASTKEVGTSGVSRHARAYESLTGAMLALAPEELEQINLDIPSAASATQGALPEIMALRARAEKLPDFDIRNFDLLEQSALAMDHANTVHVMVTKPEEPVSELAEKCRLKVQVLKSDAETLAVRNIIHGAPLSQLRGGNNHRNLSFDLFALAYLLRANWQAIQGRTALTLEELTEAEQLADRLSVALGFKQQSASAAGPAADMRQRSFTLFMRTLRQVERAVTFLEPVKAADILPTIRVPRGPGKKRVEAAEPAAPSQTGVHAVVGAAEVAARSADAPDEEPIAVGMPGSNPYKV
jgi:hypothetical protein